MFSGHKQKTTNKFLPLVLCSTLPTKPAAQPPLSPSPLTRHKLLDPKIIASLCLKDLLQADHKMIWPWPFDHMPSTLVQLHTGDTFWPNQLWLTTLDWNSAGPQKNWCPQAWHGLPNAKYKFIPFDPHQAARAPPIHAAMACFQVTLFAKDPAITILCLLHPVQRPQVPFVDLRACLGCASNIRKIQINLKRVTLATCVGWVSVCCNCKPV